MSMWELEALAEECVRLVADSHLSMGKKRQLYASAYELVGAFDVSFIHFRTTQPLFDAQFLFRIELREHPEFEDHRERFQELELGTAKSEWLFLGPKNERGYPSGPADGIYQAREIAGHPPGLWFDATMPLWAKTVQAGLLTGLAATPVEPLSPKEAIVRFAELANEAGEARDGLLKMLHGMAVYALGFGEEVPAPGDEELAGVLALPGLGRALSTPQEDWIDERFDARGMLEQSQGAAQEFLQWWCSAYPAGC